MTVRPSTIFTSCAVMALSVAAAPFAQASASAKPEIDYFLSRTNVAVSVAMTLVSCPGEEGELPGIETEWQVVPTAKTDLSEPVRVDVSNGFLAKRSNAFEFYPNGTLSGFNGSSEGQGGPLLISVLKTIATVAPMVMASTNVDFANTEAPEKPPVSGPLYCRDAVVKALKQLGETKAEIRRLEDKVLSGSATSAELDMLERRRLKKIAQGKALSFEEGVEAMPFSIVGSWEGEIELPKLLENWFSPLPGKEDTAAVPFESAKLEGIAGFDVQILPIRPEFSAGMQPAITPKSPASSRKYELQRSLVYRRPTLAKVNITDRNCRPVRDCSETLELDAPLPIGQWGKISSLPVGNAGLFGSREASASFDPFGTPLKLSYGSDSGAADIGSTIEAAGGTVTALADSDTAALERKIKREELRQKLRELRATAVE